MLWDISLTINVEKSCYIVFNKKCMGAADACVKLQGFPLERRSEITYFGVIITDALNVEKDVDRATTSFLEQLNSMYFKFNYVN